MIAHRGWMLLDTYVGQGSEQLEEASPLAQMLLAVRRSTPTPIRIAVLSMQGMKEMDCYVFTDEPRGVVYGQLVEFCCMVGPMMLLVVRDPHLDPGDSIKSRLDLLSPFLLGSSRENEWPGTVLYADEAAVYRYSSGEGLRERLKQQAASLFSWIHPDAPEDPCFLRRSGDALLVTISHEREAYVLLSADEIQIVRRGFPELASILQKE